jgi:hypothetical protein
MRQSFKTSLHADIYSRIPVTGGLLRAYYKHTHTRFNIQSARLNHQTPYVPRDSIAVSTARLAAVNRTAASAAADGGDYVNAVLTIMAVRLRPNWTVGGQQMFLRCLVVF